MMIKGKSIQPNWNWLNKHSIALAIHEKAISIVTDMGYIVTISESGKIINIRRYNEEVTVVKEVENNA